VSRRKSVARTTVMATQGSTTKAKSITLDIGLGTLTGTVKGLKKGDRVTAYDTKAKLNYEIARATKGGTLKIRAKLGPGTYRLSVDKLNLVSKTVRIRSGKQVSAGTITAPSKRNRLTGIVKGSNGKPLANARVVISNRYGIKVS